MVSLSKNVFKLAQVVTFLGLCQFAQAATPVQLNTSNNLEANGAASNNFAHDIKVQLHPHAEVVGRGFQTVSFGFPLPPGVIVNTNNIVVLDESENEVSAHVSSLAAWNAMPPKPLLCDGYQSSGNPGVRSVLIQFESAFANSNAKNFRVKLNQPRQKNIASKVDIESTLRQVNDGLYANHNLSFQVKEAKILTTIEPQYLSCTNMTSLSGELGKNASMVNTDQAQHDFFYTSIQEFFDRPVSNYTFDIFRDGIKYAYWLYDRPQTFLNGYMRSGNVDQLRAGLQAADHFRHEIYTEEECATTTLLPKYDCVGFFKLKNKVIGNPYKDSKYSYNENLVTAYLLTGNSDYLDVIPLPTVAVQKTVDFNNHGVSTKPAATERHRGNALLTTVMHYELTNDQALLPFITTAVDALYQRQQEALDGSTVNGCFNYSPEGTSEESFSPSILLSEALCLVFVIASLNIGFDFLLKKNLQYIYMYRKLESFLE